MPVPAKLTFEELLENISTPDGKSAVRFREALSDTQVEQLAKAIATSPCVRRVDLSKCEISSPGALLLAHALENNPRLETLYLATNQINTEAAIVIGKAALHHPSLRHLALADNLIGPEVGDVFADLVRENRLHELTLNKNQMGHAVINHIAQALADNQSLERLSLYNNGENQPELEQTLARSIIETGNVSLFHDPGNGSGLVKEHTSGNEAIAGDCYQTLMAGYEDSEYLYFDPSTWKHIIERQEVVLRYAERYGMRELLTPEVSRVQKLVDDLPDIALEPAEKMDTAARIRKLAAWEDLPGTLAAHHQEGRQFQNDALLNKDGTPSALLGAAIETKQQQAFFTQENWLGASPNDVRTVLAAMPDYAQERITNRHQLVTALGRDARAQER